MKALELLKNQEDLLVVDKATSKHIRNLSSSLNQLMKDMNNQILSFKQYTESQLDGELNGKIIVIKSLAGFFKNNKFLRLENIVNGIKHDENTRLSALYSVKTKLLDTLRTLIKESYREAVISAYDIFEQEFKKCEVGHEIIVLNGKNVDVLESFLKELDLQIVMNGNFDSIDSQEVDFNTSVLDRNISLCSRKNDEVYGDKHSKHSKIVTMIEHLEFIGKQVVAFYTYKDTLIDIGCNPKAVRDYENELSKLYIPLKKALQKEFKIELEDICNIVVNEEEYVTASVEEVNNGSPLPYITEYNPDDYITPTNDTTTPQQEEYANTPIQPEQSYQETQPEPETYSAEPQYPSYTQESQQDIIGPVTPDTTAINENSYSYNEPAYQEEQPSFNYADQQMNSTENYNNSYVANEYPQSNEESNNYYSPNGFNNHLNAATQEDAYNQYNTPVENNYNQVDTAPQYVEPKHNTYENDTNNQSYNAFNNTVAQNNNMFNNQYQNDNMFNNNYSNNMSNDANTINNNIESTTPSNNMLEDNTNDYGGLGNRLSNPLNNIPNKNPFGSSTGNMFED